MECERERDRKNEKKMGFTACDAAKWMFALYSVWDMYW